MMLATANSSKTPRQYRMANDTVDRIPDNAIPMLPYRHPPNRFDYEKLPQHRREQQQEKKKKDDRKPPESGEEFHIDDYV